MKVAYVNGKKLKIRNDDYKSLLQRFDLRNFKNNYNESMCPLCDRYRCCECPCKKNELNGCFSVMEYATKWRDRKIECGSSFIQIYGKTGRKQINKIYDFLIHEFESDEKI